MQIFCQWTWLDSFPPVGGLYAPDRRAKSSPGEVDRLARADMADFRDHGFDLVMLNYYFGASENPDGTFQYDVSSLSRDLEYCKMLGSRAPVVLTIEYACRNFEYQFAEPGTNHVPGTFSEKARRAIVGLVKHIHDEAQRHDWPKLYFYPIDEPGNNKTDNRLLFARNVLDFVHQVPGCQTATTLTAGDVQRLGDRVDVRIYAYGHFNRTKVLQEAKQGHPYWWYNNGMFYGHSTSASRGYAGFEFLRSGAEVATAWGFAATQANPYNDFDGGHKDWNVIFPGVDAPTPTIYWELCREGVDDCRYVATLQEKIRQAKGDREPAAAQRAEKVLAPLIDPDLPAVWTPQAFARYRWRIAREILNLLNEPQFSLSFQAIASNAVGETQLGPNAIEDPSFENGPDADGFPSLGFNISDRYAKSEAKPTGALVVTDEVAHSGRYSLKWDFSKALGKGSLYDRNRYLIVNVQVPPSAATSLHGRRVKVGLWFRLGGGSLSPGWSLRQFGKGEFLGGIEYSGGVADPAVWNHLETEGRLHPDFEGLDIHIHCRVPEEDAELARKSSFYIDDITLQAVEEPPLVVTTPLDEYYIGEKVPWTGNTLSSRGQAKVQLVGPSGVAPDQVVTVEERRFQGQVDTRGFAPGVYTLQATADVGASTPASAQHQFILAPDPFDWTE